MSLFKSCIIVFIIILSYSACKLDKPIIPDNLQSSSSGNGTTTGSGSGSGSGSGGSGTGSSTNATYYIKGTLNGQAFTWNVDYVTWGTGNAKLSTIDQKGVETAELDGMISNYASSQAIPSISIGFRTYQINMVNSDQSAVSAYFNTFINAGSWDYATDNALTANTQKIAIYYNDANGNAYSSEGVQTGSTATISSVKQVAASLGVNESLDIKLSFSCKLYNLDGSGKSITLTNVQASINVPDNL